MSTLYVYRIVATIIIGIPFIRYIIKFIFKNPPKDVDDFITRDTYNKAKLIILLYPAMYLAMFILAIIKVKNKYYGPEFCISLIVLTITIVFTVCDWLVHKYKVNKYVIWIVHVIYLIVPIAYFYLVMTTPVPK